MSILKGVAILGASVGAGVVVGRAVGTEVYKRTGNITRAVTTTMVVRSATMFAVAYGLSRKFQ